MTWARYITGWVTARVSGAAPEKFLCALAERGIPFWEAGPPVDYALTVRIPWRAARLVEPLAASLGCEGTILRRHGLPALARRLKNRYFLWAGFALVLGLLYVGSAFIWEIEIEGNDTVPDGVIRQALSQCGVDIGAYWPAMSQDAVRNGVILRVPGIRWMTVTMRGSHARVIVRERYEHLPVVPEREYANIVAVKAGLIEHVDAFQGTALTEETKAVLPGETLIGGYVTGRIGVQGPVRAVGAVTARTWYELTAKMPAQAMEKTYTGRGHTRWALVIGKTRINFYKDSSICPAGCDKIIEEYPLAKNGLFALPLTLVKITYAPYEASVAEDGALRGELETRLRETLADAIGEDGEVLSSRFSASMEDGALYGTLRAECREQIGQTVPFTDEDLAEVQDKVLHAKEQWQ